MSASSRHNQPWHGKAIALLDLDAFFASVEQLDHPEWRGKPVIVGGRSNKRGVVATASYEARKYGVHSAQPAYLAEQLCPHAIWTRGRFDRYRELSQQVMTILEETTPYVEQVSIDEAYFDITPGRYSNNDPISIITEIQKRVDTLGITCSIGLATNKSLAKIASDKNKPHGITVVYPGEERAFLSPLPISDLSGIGPKTAQKLKIAGITTLGELGEADDDVIMHLLGSLGSEIKQRAQGIDERPVEKVDEVKSVSHEHTFDTDLYDEDALQRELYVLSQKVGRRLRKHKVTGSTITVKVRFDLTTTKTMQRTITEPTDDESVFYPLAVSLLKELLCERRGVRLLGVGVSHFETRHTQLNLFEGMQSSLFTDDQPAHHEAHAQQSRQTRRPGSNRKESSREELYERKKRLTQAKDQVREKFGESSLMLGRELTLSASDKKRQQDTDEDHFSRS